MKRLFIALAFVLGTSACNVGVDTDIDDALDSAIDRIESYVDDAGQSHEIIHDDSGEGGESTIADQTEELEDLGEGNLIGRFSVIQNSCQAVPSMLSLYSYDNSDAIDLVDINNETISRGEATGQTTFMFVAQYRDELQRLTGVINCYCDLDTDELMICNCVDDQDEQCQIYGSEQ